MLWTEREVEAWLSRVYIGELENFDGDLESRIERAIDLNRRHWCREAREKHRILLSLLSFPHCPPFTRHLDARVRVCARRGAVQRVGARTEWSISIPMRARSFFPRGAPERPPGRLQCSLDTSHLMSPSFLLSYRLTIATDETKAKRCTDQLKRRA